tara:strand:- start:2301 stop:2558 length:258 start_codon:yes stop_codon:yes gene_type:complete
MKTKLPTELPTDSLDESLELLQTITAKRQRKVRVEFEYDSDLARAVNARHGEEGEATPAQMRFWFKQYGESCDSDILMECPDFEE